MLPPPSFGASIRSALNSDGKAKYAIKPSPTAPPETIPHRKKVDIPFALLEEFDWVEEEDLVGIARFQRGWVVVPRWFLGGSEPLLRKLIGDFEGDLERLLVVQSRIQLGLVSRLKIGFR